MAKKKTIHLYVDFPCEGCAETVTDLVKNNEKKICIIACDVDVTTKYVSITYDEDSVSNEQKNGVTDYFTTMLSDCGFQARQSSIFSHLLYGITSLIAGGGLLASMIFGITFPPLLLYLVAISSTLLTLWVGRHTIHQAWNQFYNAKTFTMDTLFAVGALAAVTVSLLSLCFTSLPMMFDAGLMIFGFKRIGNVVQLSCRSKLVQNTTFQDFAPQKITRVHLDNRKAECSIHDLPASDFTQGDQGLVKIIIQPNDYFPVDVKYNKRCRVNTGIHNGKTFDHDWEANKTILAGTQYKGKKAIIVTVVNDFNHSKLAKLDKELHDAVKNKTKIQTQTQMILNDFIPMIFLLAAGFATLATIYTTPVIAIYTALAVLTSSCPCVLGLLVPMAFKLGIVSARTDGIEFKSTEALESAASIDHVVFDLNGTLTKGEASVDGIDIVDNVYKKSKINRILLTLEQSSDHDFAKAINKYCMSNQKYEQAKFDENFSHGGVRANINSTEYTLGNRYCLEENGIMIADEHFSSSVTAQHFLYLSENNKIIARIRIRDQLRPEAKPVIDQLKNTGKKIYICTGAPEETACNYAFQLGILDYKKYIIANCEPNDKVKFIQDISKTGNVAHVGDAPNDTQGMAASHLGIAMSTAKDITKNHASVILNKEGLNGIISTFFKADVTVSKVKEILFMNFAYNLLMIGIAGLILPGLGIMITPGIGYALMIIQSIVLTYSVMQISNAESPKVAIPDHATEEDEYSSSSSYAKLIYTSELLPMPDPSTQKTALPRPSAAWFEENKAQFYQWWNTPPGFDPHPDNSENKYERYIRHI